MLLALLDGRALPAAELARRGGVSPQAASAQLAKLARGGLLSVRRNGRRRLYALRAPDVGYALDSLATLAPPVRIVALRQNRVAAQMRDARSCYDHLAGRLGVAVTDALLARKVLRLQVDAFEVTRAGEAFLRELGIETRVLRVRRRAFARACVDWTERRPHLAGSLGAALRACFLETHGSNARPRSAPSRSPRPAERRSRRTSAARCRTTRRRFVGDESGQAIYDDAMKSKWQVEEAGAELSAVIEAAKIAPQIITRYGTPVAVVLSCAEYDRLRRRDEREPLISFFRSWPDFEIPASGVAPVKPDTRRVKNWPR
jgi:prevent-host-death family protein